MMSVGNTSNRTWACVGIVAGGAVFVRILQIAIDPFWEGLLLAWVRPMVYATMLALCFALLGSDRNYRVTGQISAVLAACFVIVYFAGAMIAMMLLGAGENALAHDLPTWLQTAWRLGSVIIMQEWLRYKIIANARMHAATVGLLLGAGFGIALLGALPFGAGAVSVGEFLFGSVFLIVVYNLVMTAFAIYGNLAAMFIMAAGFSLAPALSPLVPAATQLGWSLFSAMIMFVCWLVYMMLVADEAPQMGMHDRKVKKASPAGLVVLAAVFALVLSFMLGALPYYPVVVRTHSMTPNINRGALVIVQRLRPEQVADAVDLGAVIHFTGTGLEMVHRVIDIQPQNGGYAFLTRGDANPTHDGAPIEAHAVRGRVRFALPWLGLPSLLVRELFE